MSQQYCNAVLHWKTVAANRLVHKPRGGSRGRVQGVLTPPPPEMTCGFLIQLVFCKKKLCGLLEETSAPPPKKNPGSAPETIISFTVVGAAGLAKKINCR